MFLQLSQARPVILLAQVPTHDEKAALQRLQDLSAQLDRAKASQRAATSELTKAQTTANRVRKAVRRVTKALKQQRGTPKKRGK